MTDGKKVQTTRCKLSAYLEVSALRLEPVLDELLRVVTEAEHEVSLGLQLVDGFNSLMDLMENVNVWLKTAHIYAVYVTS